MLNYLTLRQQAVRGTGKNLLAVVSSIQGYIAFHRDIQVAGINAH